MLSSTRMSPRWKAGSIEPLQERGAENTILSVLGILLRNSKHALVAKQSDARCTHLSTTTTGLSDLVKTIRPFHIIRAENTIIAKLSTEKDSCNHARDEWLPM